MKVDHCIQARPWRFTPLLVIVVWYGFFVPNACASQPIPGPASPEIVVQTNTSKNIPTVWQAQNRSILIGFDLLNRQYKEFDSSEITPDGILDAEKGTLTGGAFRGRWQGDYFVIFHI
jgi:hypothetical protein